MERTNVKFDGWMLAVSLTVIFTVFRVCGIVDWPWWILLMPMFVDLAVVVVLLVVVGAAGIYMYSKIKGEKDEDIQS